MIDNQKAISPSWTWALAAIALTAVLAAALISMASGPASAADPGTCDPARPHAAGGFDETITSGGGTREYSLPVPPSDTGSETDPVGFSFHALRPHGRDQTADRHPPPRAAPLRPAAPVRNLVVHPTARRRSLRAPQNGHARCAHSVRALAAANPRIAFTLTCDARVALDLPPNQSPKERALAILGPELESRLLEVHADEFDDARGLSLWGLVGLPAIARATKRANERAA